jgi:hypothetical protein
MRRLSPAFFFFALAALFVALGGRAVAGSQDASQARANPPSVALLSARLARATSQLRALGLRVTALEHEFTNTSRIAVTADVGAKEANGKVDTAVTRIDDTMCKYQNDLGQLSFAIFAGANGATPTLQPVIPVLQDLTSLVSDRKLLVEPCPSP